MRACGHYASGYVDGCADCAARKAHDVTEAIRAGVWCAVRTDEPLSVRPVLTVIDGGRGG